MEIDQLSEMAPAQTLEESAERYVRSALKPGTNEDTIRAVTAKVVKATRKALKS
jgi:hypothetical protein